MQTHIQCSRHGASHISSGWACRHISGRCLLTLNLKNCTGCTEWKSIQSAKTLPPQVSKWFWHSLSIPSITLCNVKHYGLRAMEQQAFGILELCLSFSPHANISDENFNLVHHFICVQIFQINEEELESKGGRQKLQKLLSVFFPPYSQAILGRMFYHQGGGYPQFR